MDEKKLTEFEKILNEAKSSKHTDAILLLLENKPAISDAIKNAMNKKDAKELTGKKKEADELIKKMIAITCEFVFTACVDILVCDKK